MIEDGGFGPGYTYFTHRLGHGIGLDGHEWPYMVRGNATRLAAGMTFTDEPGIYIPGELGIRHEDTVAVTENGCENLAPEVVGDARGAGRGVSSRRGRPPVADPATPRLRLPPDCAVREPAEDPGWCAGPA